MGGQACCIGKEAQSTPAYYFVAPLSYWWVCGAPKKSQTTLTLRFLAAQNNIVIHVTKRIRMILLVWSCRRTVCSSWVHIQMQGLPMPYCRVSGNLVLTLKRMRREIMEQERTSNDVKDDVNCNIEQGGRISLTFCDRHTYIIHGLLQERVWHWKTSNLKITFFNASITTVYQQRWYPCKP